jgi:hypothetical protein
MLARSDPARARAPTRRVFASSDRNRTGVQLLLRRLARAKDVAASPHQRQRLARAPFVRWPVPRSRANSRAWTRCGRPLPFTLTVISCLALRRRMLKQEPARKRSHFA